MPDAPDSGPDVPDSCNATFSHGWRQRLRALRNIPPMLTMVWASGSHVVATCVALHFLAAVIPIAMLSVSRVIIDAVVASDELPNLPHLELDVVGHVAVAKVKEALLALTGG